MFSRKIVWIVILVVIIVATLALLVLQYKQKSSNNIKTTSIQKQSAETWEREASIVFNNMTSTDTHKISDNLYRMYAQKDGKIMYSESTDGKSWGNFTSTGIGEDTNMMISNPAALKLTNDNWVLVYEQSPLKKPGQNNKNEPGPENQRNLYLATSVDGKSFVKAGLAIDSSKNDNYFASVPDLVLMPDNRIRLYYVCRGDSICSQTSSDNGLSWAKESGYRLTDVAVDPDVLIRTENNQTKWVMYYTILDPQKNGLYKAISDDGLTWTKLDGVVVQKSNANGAIVDADVFETTDDNYLMNFGESQSGDSTGGEQINLYRANYRGEIFK